MALTDKEIRAAKGTDKKIKLFDSGGLFLIVTPRQMRFHPSVTNGFGSSNRNSQTFCTRRNGTEIPCRPPFETVGTAYRFGRPPRQRGFGQATPILP
jgi:hypothetical protein